MRTTNQKIVFSWILYFTDIFTKSQRQKRPAAGGNALHISYRRKGAGIKKRYQLLFSLYNLNTREHILTLSFYHKRYNDDKIKRS